MIARTISKSSTGWGQSQSWGQNQSNQPTNQTNYWPTNWTTDQLSQQPTKNIFSVRPKIIEQPKPRTSE